MKCTEGDFFVEMVSIAAGFCSFIWYFELNAA